MANLLEKAVKAVASNPTVQKVASNAVAKAGAKTASSKNTVDLRSSGSSDTGGGWIGSSSPSTVQVNPDGTAPSGLSAGTLVNTAGGTYRIDSVNPDGTYNSSKLGGNTITPNTSSASGGPGGYYSEGTSSYWPVYGLNDILSNRRANLMGLGIGDMYGITYDQDKLLKVYNQATDAQYALKQKEQQIAENKYYQNLYNTQNSTIDALRAQRNSQIASGMSAGLAAAADSATAMGIQREGAAGALELANARQTMADEIAAAYAQNIVSALQDSNTLRAQIAGLDLNKYGYDTNWDAALAAAIPEFNAGTANMAGADLGYKGLLYQTDANERMNKENIAAQLEAARISANAQIAAARYNAMQRQNSNTDDDKISLDEWYKSFPSGDAVAQYVLANGGTPEQAEAEKQGYINYQLNQSGGQYTPKVTGYTSIINDYFQQYKYKDENGNIKIGNSRTTVNDPVQNWMDTQLSYTNWTSILPGMDGVGDFNAQLFRAKKAWNKAAKTHDMTDAVVVPVDSKTGLVTTDPNAKVQYKVEVDGKYY